METKGSSWYIKCRWWLKGRHSLNLIVPKYTCFNEFHRNEIHAYFWLISSLQERRGSEGKKRQFSANVNTIEMLYIWGLCEEAILSVGLCSLFTSTSAGICLLLKATSSLGKSPAWLFDVRPCVQLGGFRLLNLQCFGNTIGDESTGRAPFTDTCISVALWPSVGLYECLPRHRFFFKCKFPGDSPLSPADWMARRLLQGGWERVTCVENTLTILVYPLRRRAGACIIDSGRSRMKLSSPSIQWLYLV